MHADDRSVMNRNDLPLLRIRDLTVSFPARSDYSSSNAPARHRVICGLNLTIQPAETLAVVGESGSGKSLTALSILGLLPSSALIERGTIHFDQRDLLQLTRREMLKIRGGNIAMIFQEPMTSLNPVMTIGDQIIEAIQLHQHVSRRQACDIAVQALRDVGIADAQKRLRAYPHQFSGGMRQRGMIAMALACQPKLLLADEPTTALDVTVQKQILELLRALQQQRGMAIMLITHDLGIVAQHADHVCVMYQGRIMEMARVRDLFAHPLHPYTQGLLHARPSLKHRSERLCTIAEFLQQHLHTHIVDEHDGATTLHPWWPETSDANAYEMREIRPNHWVACAAQQMQPASAT